MDEKQADAIARAILEPDRQAREQLRRKREAEAARLVLQRRAAGAALAGMAVGGAVGHFASGDFPRWLVVGGLIAYLLARLVQRRPA
jgi:uncharacterized membrane protein YfcA